MIRLGIQGYFLGDYSALKARFPDPDPTFVNAPTDDSTVSSYVPSQSTGTPDQSPFLSPCSPHRSISSSSDFEIMSKRDPSDSDVDPDDSQFTEQHVRPPLQTTDPFVHSDITKIPSVGIISSGEKSHPIGPVYNSNSLLLIILWNNPKIGNNGC